MDKEPRLSMPVPELRFRIPLLLIVTAFVAVLAAVAAPYYSEQPANAQTNLLIFWSTLVIFAGVGFRDFWRVMNRLPPDAGSVRFILPRITRRVSRLRSVAFPLLSGVTNLALIIVFTWNVAEASREQGPPIWFSPLMGATIGFSVGQSFLPFLKTPAYLCDNCILFFRGYAPWRYIHSATWGPSPEYPLILHQRIGDLIVTVPPSDRDQVDAFVRGKTVLLESTENS